MSTSHPSSPLPSLPPSRDFMTSLFNSLTFPNASPTQTSNPNPNPDSDSNSASVAHPQRLSRENERDDGKQTQNPFKQLDAQKKALLMTLHVIFPPPLLLHALDLLDRGGVTRVILREEGEIGGRAGTGEGVEQRNSRERKGTEKKSSDAGEQEQESSRDMEGGDIEVGESDIDAHKHKLSLLHPSPSHPSPNPPPPKIKTKTKTKTTLPSALLAALKMAFLALRVRSRSRDRACTCSCRKYIRRTSRRLELQLCRIYICCFSCFHFHFHFHFYFPRVFLFSMGLGSLSGRRASHSRAKGKRAGGNVAIWRLDENIPRTYL